MSQNMIRTVSQFSAPTSPINPLDDSIQRFIGHITHGHQTLQAVPCNITSVGDFLNDAHLSLSELAHQLVNSEYIYASTSDEVKNYMSGEVNDMNNIDIMDDQLHMLKKFQQELRKNAGMLDDNWRILRQNTKEPGHAAPHVPEHMAEVFPDPLPEHLRGSMPVPLEYRPTECTLGPTSPNGIHVNAKPETGKLPTLLAEAPLYAVTPAPNSLSPSTDDGTFGENLPASPIDPLKRDILKTRGKGKYTCPYVGCTKGGLSADGTKVVFERNCSFRAHLQKHEKSFKCDIPGCPNQDGFARVDQLKRHQQTVRHGRFANSRQVPRRSR